MQGIINRCNRSKIVYQQLKKLLSLTISSRWSQLEGYRKSRKNESHLHYDCPFLVGIDPV
jgi:hypothetical protein